MNSHGGSVHRRERERESRASETMEQREVRLRKETERVVHRKLYRRERHVCSECASVGSKNWFVRLITLYTRTLDNFNHHTSVNLLWATMLDKISSGSLPMLASV